METSSHDKMSDSDSRQCGGGESELPCEGGPALATASASSSTDAASVNPFASTTASSNLFSPDGIKFSFPSSAFSSSQDIANTTASSEDTQSKLGLCQKQSQSQVAALNSTRTKRTKDKKAKNTFSFSSEKGVTFSSVSASSVSAGTC
jgi:hypothetical protein